MKLFKKIKEFFWGKSSEELNKIEFNPNLYYTKEEVDRIVKEIIFGGYEK